MRSKFLTNPFSLYGVAFGIVLVFYSFGWSDMYPKISMPLFMFMATTILIMFFIGYLFYRRDYFRYSKAEASDKSLGRQLVLCYLLLIVEFAADRTIPIVALIRGSGADYTSFGLPFVHIIYAAYQGFLALYIYHVFLSRDKGNRKKLGWYLFWSLLPGVLIVNRAMVMTTLIGIGLIYLMQVKSIRKVLFSFTIISLVFLYLFGLLGNLRTNGRADSEAIMSIGKANDDFKENLVPGEFFWSYLYIASPLGNLQNNINTNNNAQTIEGENVKQLVVFEFMPEMLSKRIASSSGMEREKVNLVIELLNAYSVYAAAYSYMGWTGIWLMFGFTLFFVFINLILIPRDSPYFVVGVALISTILIMNIFNNFFSFMNIVSQLLVVNILSLPYLIKTIKTHAFRRHII